MGTSDSNRKDQQQCQSVTSRQQRRWNGPEGRSQQWRQNSRQPSRYQRQPRKQRPAIVPEVDCQQRKSPPPVALASAHIHEAPRPEDLPKPPSDWLLSLEATRPDERPEDRVSEDPSRQEPSRQEKLVAPMQQQKCQVATAMLKQLLHLQA